MAVKLVNVKEPQTTHNNAQLSFVKHVIMDTFEMRTAVKLVNVLHKHAQTVPNPFPVHPILVI